MGKKVVFILTVVLLLCWVVQPGWAQPSLSINGQAAVLLDAVNTMKIIRIICIRLVSQRF